MGLTGQHNGPGLEGLPLDPLGGGLPFDLHFLPFWIVEFSDIVGRMSFNITVTTSLGTSVVSTSGEVPDGDFVISGHEDDSQRTLAVTRRGEDGRYVQQASAVHHKEIS